MFNIFGLPPIIWVLLCLLIGLILLLIKATLVFVGCLIKLAIVIIKSKILGRLKRINR